MVNVPFFGFYNTNHLQLLVGNIIRVRLGDVKMGHLGRGPKEARRTEVQSFWKLRASPTLTISILFRQGNSIQNEHFIFVVP